VPTIPPILPPLGGPGGLSVPAIILGTSGLLVFLLILAQIVGAAAWLPVIRRVLGPTGLRVRGRQRRST
jgi:hypothetical protein